MVVMVKGIYWCSGVSVGFWVEKVRFYILFVLCGFSLLFGFFRFLLLFLKWV